MKSSKPKVQVVDTRTPEQKVTESYFSGLVQKPGMGYDERRMGVLDPVYAKYNKQAQELSRNAMSQSGISPFSGIGARRGSQVGEDVALDKARTEFSDRAMWESMVTAGAKGSPMQAFSSQPGPSPFSTMMGGLLSGFGGPLGTMAGNALFPQQQQPYRTGGGSAYVMG